MTWHVEIQNIAGILDGGAKIEPGLNAVRGSNWQGKSSFIQAIKTGLGVSTALTEGAENGSVTLRTADGEVVVELTRSDTGVQRTDRPYLTDKYDTARTELFACLDETNEIRRAVRNGESLEDLLTGPLDFQNIDEQISSLRHEREQVKTELAKAREAKKKLPSAQEKVTQLEAELEELRDKYESLTDDSEPRDDANVESAQTALAEARSEREQAQSQIERLERSIERTESGLADKQSELDDVSVPETGDIESELVTVRDELQTLKGDRDVLQSVYSATEMVLDENRFELISDVQHSLTGDTVVCWTCGDEATRADIESQLDELGEKLADRRATIQRKETELDELQSTKKKAGRAKRRKENLEDEITELGERLADHRESLADAKQRRQEAAERVEELSEAVDDTVDEITDVESDIKYREAELNDARDELESLQTRADRVETLEETKTSLTEELENLRNRKEELKYETREAFDRAMQDILDRFDTGFETARLTSKFNIVVARDGREASLDALSEGEVELIGFVAALAGYEAFDVDEVVPILLVDSVGALSDENLQTLIRYLNDRVDYLVFTVYPEYSSFEGWEIDPSTWDVANDSPNAMS